MGVVYRAQDPAIGRIIAIKTIRLSELTENEERDRLRDRLFREAQSAGILSHPNIVTIYDIAEENEFAYVFMEFVNGPSLEKLLGSANPPGKDEILTILRQIAAALDYAHRKGIVHRDIKPSNVMIHDDGQAKITDFGVAKIVSKQMTQSGAIMGTPNYMSPEQIQGLAVDGHTDQFSLGVIAYEILTGERPFAGEYLPTLLYKIVREDPIPPRRINQTLGERVDPVIAKALAKDGKLRFATCAEFIAALTEACNANPAWMPLKQGDGQSMPTVVAVPSDAAQIVARPEYEPAKATREYVPPSAAGPVIARPLVLPEDTQSGQLWKSVLWVVLGIGLVGLVVLAGQRLFFHEGAAPAPTQTAEKAPVIPAAPIPEPVKTKPEPRPVETVAKSIPPPVRETPPDKPPKTMDFDFTSTPQGARVVVDGDPALSCTTNCKMPLVSGHHGVVLTLQGYRQVQKIIGIGDKSLRTIVMEKESGTIHIGSNPPGAAIQIDGEDFGIAPKNVNLRPGTHQLVLSKGAAQEKRSVEVKDGVYGSVEISLESK